MLTIFKLIIIYWC